MVQRKAGVTSEIVEGQAVLIAPSGKEIVTLNVVGTLIWNACDVATDVSGLTDHLLEEFTDVDRDELERDVREFLAELLESDLIDEVSGT